MRPIVSGALSLALCLLLSGCGGSSSSSSGSTVAPSTSAAPVTSSSTTPASSSASSAPLPSAAPVLANGTISLLTYNVAGLPQGLSGSDPVRNIPQISPLLNTYDLVLVQEDFWYHNLTEQSANHAHRSQPLIGYSTFMGDGLNRFSETAFRDLRRVKWSDCNGVTGGSNDCLASKGFSLAIHELAPGLEVHVYNLHADAGSGPDDIDARVKNFAQLARFMSAFSANEAVIVAGDTNLKDGTLRPRDGQTLDDFLGTTGLQEVARLLSHPSIIDRVMFRSSAKIDLSPVLWRLADEFLDSNGNDLSDHPAVNVDFVWQEK